LGNPDQTRERNAEIFLNTKGKRRVRGGGAPWAGQKKKGPKPAEQKNVCPRSKSVRCSQPGRQHQKKTLSPAHRKAVKRTQAATSRKEKRFCPQERGNCGGKKYQARAKEALHPTRPDI